MGTSREDSGGHDAGAVEAAGRSQKGDFAEANETFDAATSAEEAGRNLKAVSLKRRPEVEAADLTLGGHGGLHRVAAMSVFLHGVESPSILFLLRVEEICVGCRPGVETSCPGSS